MESTHQIHVAVVDESGALHSRVGDVDRAVFFRSAAKPLQAVPLVEDGVVDRFGLTGEELALCCASHNAEPKHVEAALSVLGKVGLSVEHLECGPHPPMSEGAASRLAESGRSPGREHNNCSGKHAGMLALAVHHGWATAGYVASGHPVQKRMLAEVSRWTGLPAATIGTGIDGCGVVTFAVSLKRMAWSFARFAAAANGPGAPRTIVGAMTQHPFFVAGTGRLCSAVMAVAGERVFLKTGAEGVYCAGVPSRGMGIALKVEDGARRGSEVAILRVLEALSVLDAPDLDVLGPFRTPMIRNTRNEVTGEIQADLTLEPHS